MSAGEIIDISKKIEEDVNKYGGQLDEARTAIMNALVCHYNASRSAPAGAFGEGTYASLTHEKMLVALVALTNACNFFAPDLAEGWRKQKEKQEKSLRETEEGAGK